MGFRNTSDLYWHYYVLEIYVLSFPSMPPTVNQDLLSSVSRSHNDWEMDNFHVLFFFLWRVFLFFDPIIFSLDTLKLLLKITVYILAEPLIGSCITRLLTSLLNIKCLTKTDKCHALLYDACTMMVIKQMLQNYMEWLSREMAVSK